jgi:hypothetical protein
MRLKHSHTIPIHFPETPEVLHTALFKEEYILRVLWPLCGVLIVAYVTLVSLSVVHVIARKEAMEKAIQTRSIIAELEHDYFARSEALTAAMAHERQLLPVSNKRYIERLTAVGVAETDERGL